MLNASVMYCLMGCQNVSWAELGRWLLSKNHYEVLRALYPPLQCVQPRLQMCSAGSRGVLVGLVSVPLLCLTHPSHLPTWGLCSLPRHQGIPGLSTPAPSLSCSLLAASWSCGQRVVLWEERLPGVWVKSCLQGAVSHPSLMVPLLQPRLSRVAAPGAV